MGESVYSDCIKAGMEGTVQLPASIIVPCTFMEQCSPWISTFRYAGRATDNPWSGQSCRRAKAMPREAAQPRGWGRAAGALLVLHSRNVGGDLPAQLGGWGRESGALLAGCSAGCWGRAVGDAGAASGAARKGRRGPGCAEPGGALSLLPWPVLCCCWVVAGGRRATGWGLACQRAAGDQFRRAARWGPAAGEQGELGWGGLPLTTICGSHRSSVGRGSFPWK